MSKRRAAAPSLQEHLAAKASEPEVPVRVNVERLFVVTKTCLVPREGSTHYTLHAGTTISSFGYDVDALLAMGVPLEPVQARVEPPRVRILG